MNMLKKIIFFVIITMLFAGNSFCGEINVSAAISLKNAFEEIGRVYERTYKGNKVLFNFGASGDLKKQIEGGAPVDIFASAAQKDMNDLAGKELIIRDSRMDFASNSVVLVKPAGSKTAISSFDDLTMAEIKKISIGNPASVPAGKYAKEVLTHFGVWEKIENRTVFAENVRQVLDYVSRNEVDAGIVYETDAMTVPEKVVIAVKAPAESHAPVIYPAALIKDSKNKDDSKRFMDILCSAKSIEILKKYGFAPVK